MGFLPRSVVFVTLDELDYVLCTLGDGSLYTFRFALETAALHDRRKVSLGTKPVLLQVFQSEAGTNVFAASDRPAIIYSRDQKLSFSDVNLNEVNQLCPFHASAFPHSLALMGNDTLTIGGVDEIQKLRVRSIPLGEMPRRIAHHSQGRSFLVLTEQMSQGNPSSHLRVLNDQSFELHDSFSFEEGEYGSALEVLVRELSEGEEFLIAVGTSRPQENEAQVSSGRMLFFHLEPNSKQLQLLAERAVGGAVYAMKSFEGNILAAVNGTIALVSREDNNVVIHDTVSANNVTTLQLATRGGICAAADLMRSVSVIHFDQVNKELREISRDATPHMMTAVEIIDADHFIGAEEFYNLFTLEKNSASEAKHTFLDTVGTFHVGEFINRFRHGSLCMKSMDADCPQISTILFGTVNGSIGVIATLTEEDFEFWKRVEQNINKVIKGIGGFEHSDWRSFRDDGRTTQSRGFVDGDLVESFLDLSAEKMNEVVSSLDGWTKESLCRKIEEFTQTIH